MVVRMTKKIARKLVLGTDPATLIGLYESDRPMYQKIVSALAPLRRSAMNRLMIRVRVDERGNWIDKKRNARWGESGPKMRDRQMTFLGQPEYVHRVAWILFRGEIPEGHSLIRQEGREWSLCPSHMSCLPHPDAMSALHQRRKEAANG